MQTDINEWKNLNDVKKKLENQGVSKEKAELRIITDVRNGKYIEFKIGEKVAINGYWFKIKTIQGKNELILEGIEPTKAFKEKHGIQK